MKVFKKMLSVFLAAVMMVSIICVGTVSAGAEINSDFAVNAYDNEDGNGISVVVSGWDINDINTALDYVDNKGYIMSFTINMNDAAGKICFIRCVIDSKNIYCDLKYGNEYISRDVIPVGFEGFNTSVTNNGYGCKITLKKDHEFCDKIAEIFKAGKQIDVSADLQLSGLPFVFPIDMQTGSPFTFSVKPVWGAENGASEKDISSLKISDPKNYTYTGKNRKAAVTIKDGDYTLKKGTDYTLTYKNCKNIGTASVTIKGKGDYTGSKTLTYKIVPKKTTLKAAKKSDTKVKLSWTAVDGAEKYQIYYSTDGKNYKKLATVSDSKTSVTLSKLDFDKYNYKFKIRSYGTDDGKKYYSSFSKVVTVK